MTNIDTDVDALLLSTALAGKLKQGSVCFSVRLFVSTLSVEPID